MPTQYGTYSLLTGHSKIHQAHGAVPNMHSCSSLLALQLPTIPAHLSGTFNLTSPKHLVDEMFDYQHAGAACGASDSRSDPRALSTRNMDRKRLHASSTPVLGQGKPSPGPHEAISCNNYLAARLALHTSNRMPNLQCQGR